MHPMRGGAVLLLAGLPGGCLEAGSCLDGAMAHVAPHVAVQGIWVHEGKGGVGAGTHACKRLYERQSQFGGP